MSAQNTPTLDDRIGSALDLCIGKIAERLNQSFDPEQKESLKLFKQFCSALNARRQWLKSVYGKNDVVDVVILQDPELIPPKSAKIKPNHHTPTWTEAKLKSSLLNHPLKPSDWQNGLVMKR